MTVDPLRATQNLQWSRSKGIGFKMLKNMGWNEGEGIGKTPGTVEHIYVPVKADTRGLYHHSILITIFACFLPARFCSAGAFSALLGKLSARSSPSPSPSPNPNFPQTKPTKGTFRSVATTTVGERTFVFKLKNTVETGKAAIYLDNRFDPFPGFETPSYVHTYDVFSFQQKGDNQPSDTNLPKTQSSSDGWTHLGDIPVPSVEYFPYFVRLLVCPETEILHAPRPLSKDICTAEISNNILADKTHIQPELNHATLDQVTERNKSVDTPLGV
ncbi:hypothetical protein BLNAU_10425 [Blattamonas nauphoetae]|uniref:G-patch domain-containing protein n=1 Tax=Blattamonas nauphoetae TaxID=2049346 RepID=A0ABQ9XRP4_9EUKA|nr:hypothetical protein BLNAU_10425 [Blattamonas nauphoetae]